MFKELPSGIFAPEDFDPLGIRTLDPLDRGHVPANMAKVINPLLSVEARGRMAGLVYNTWHGVSYVKAHSGPNQPNSARQLAARARLVTIGAAWRDLTQAQRNAWAVYADAHPESDWTGNPLRLTGQNWYVRCNVQLNRIGIAAISDPPAVAAPDAITGWTVDLTVADLTVSWTAPVITDHIDIFALGPVSTGVDPKFEHATNYATVIASAATPYIILLAVPSGRWRGWGRVIDVATGLTSPWQSATEDVP